MFIYIVGIDIFYNIMIIKFIKLLVKWLIKLKLDFD